MAVPPRRGLCWTLREGFVMDGERWFRVYRATFLTSLLVATFVGLYFALGFPPELVDKASGRFLGGFDVDLWIARLGSAALVLTLAAGAAVVVSLATRAYRKLDEGHTHPPIDG